MTVGTADVVRAGLDAIVGDYGAQELMIVTITYSHDARKHSYKLIADAFGLGAAGSVAHEGARIASSGPAW